MLTITEIYNNYGYDHSLKSDFGFSCFIEEAGLLFDTGAKKEILLENLSSLNISTDDIKGVFLSHDHWDHNGGLSFVEELNNPPVSFALDSFSEKTLNMLFENTDYHIVSGWEEILSGIFSTGPLGDEIKEQSVAVQTSEGFIVISGCSHPHIGNVLRSVRGRGRILGVIGGLHDISDLDICSLLGISYLAPSHCTKRLSDIKSAYPESFIEAGAGFLHRFS